MMKKRKIKSIIWACAIVLVVGLLVLLPFLMEANANKVSDEVSYLTAKVEKNTISTTLSGGGILTEQDAVSVSVPDGVKLREYLVENGDSVTEGTVLASVDTLSVMNAITQVQDTLDTLKEQIEDASDKEAETDLTVQVGGRVMKVYCEAGDDVRTVMLEHGALVLVSLDGMLKAEFTSDAALATGDSVTVVLSDGTEVEGRVESALSGAFSVTIPDDSAPYGDKVTVKKGSDSLGTAVLEAHNIWRATAYTGTVDTVNVSEGDEISGGKTVCTIEDAQDSSEYELLTAKHRVYEEILTELFVLYQEKNVKAARDGIVTVPDDTEPYLLTAAQESYSLMLLANAPNGDDVTSYVNFLGVVSAVSETGLTLNMQPMPVQVDDYLAFAAQGVSAENMTVPTDYTPAEGTPVFYYADGAWQQGSAAELKEGDILLFAYTMDQQEPVWIVKLDTQQPPDDDPDGPGDDPGGKPDDNPGDDPNQNPVIPNPNGNGSFPWGDFNLPSGYESYLSGMGGMQQGGFPQSALYAQYAGTPMEEAVVTLYAEEETEVMTLTPCETVSVDITVDELDILSLGLGQAATVTLDALPGRSYDATVTDINTIGVNSGGSSKFTVTLTMPRGENMLGGMNAAAIIPLEEHENVLTVPVAALVEQGRKTIVYRGYDEEAGLLDPVEVTTGASDGDKVEILEGLSEGDELWYQYYDKLQISNAVESRYPGFG